jgi:BASS family bile acid:Na+ symporter
MGISSYSFIDFLLSVILAFIMMGVGLSLTPLHFKNLFLAPRPLIIGLASQIIVLPLIAFGVSLISGMPVPFRVGLIILAACPGGTTAGLLAYFFRGNVALSLTFTAINSIITLFTIPVVVNLSLMFYYGRSTVIHLSFLATIIQIFIITIIPAFLGVVLRTNFPDFAIRIQRPLKLVLAVALGIIFIIYFFAGNMQGGTRINASELLDILPIALLLNALCMTWGFLLGKSTNLGIVNSYTLGIEASVHNTTLAFLVAGTLLHNQDMVKPALIYGIFSFWTAIIYSYIVKKINHTGILSDFKT